MSDQLTLDNPVDRYPSISPPKQHQEEQGLDRDQNAQSTYAETTYQGTGRLEGRRSMATSAFPGLGAAVAIALAGGGVYVTLSYLTSEEPAARHIVELIEKEGWKE